MRRTVFAVLLLTLVSGALAVAAQGRLTAGGSTAVVKIAFNKTLKKTIVVDGAGRTLYILVTDDKDTATCQGIDPNCPKAWPALATNGSPRAGAGVKQSLLGTTKGAFGVRQVTYDHRPLYYFHGGYGTGQGDKKPGDVRGQAFADYWYVLSPKGTPIK
jgi:predicted lipoprotein with Yx(FWY)xxD motif